MFYMWRGVGHSESRSTHKACPCACEAHGPLQPGGMGSSTPCAHVYDVPEHFVSFFSEFLSLVKMPTRRYVYMQMSCVLHVHTMDIWPDVGFSLVGEKSGSNELLIWD